MTFKFKDNKINQMISKFQEGGQVAEPAPAEPAPAAPEQGGDPTEQIVMACQQALQTQDCNLAMQVMQAILQMLGGEAAPVEQAPAGQEPVYRKGGKLIRYQKKV